MIAMTDSAINIIEEYNMGMMKYKFDKSKEWLWVLIDKESLDMSPSKNFKFSKNIPNPVPNPIMQWRHPTFEHFLKLCKVYPAKPEKKSIIF
jgi:hypothetical protein